MTKRGMTPQTANEIRKAKGIEDSNLQKMRIKKGYSQNELAVASGVSVKTIRCYEQHTRPIDGARLETLCSLAIALDCKISDILENPKLIERYKLAR